MFFKTICTSALGYKITNRHKEAVRYMDNAREILSTKAGQEDKYYQDAKYVKKACGAAYKATLLALNTYLEIKEKTTHAKGNKLNVNDYRRALSDDRKMLNYYNETWDILHCAGYYNGNLNANTIREGMKAADAIINAIQPTG